MRKFFTNRQLRLELASCNRRIEALRSRDEWLKPQDREPVERGKPVHFHPPAKKGFTCGAA